MCLDESNLSRGGKKTFLYSRVSGTGTDMSSSRNKDIACCYKSEPSRVWKCVYKRKRSKEILRKHFFSFTQRNYKSICD